MNTTKGSSAITALVVIIIVLLALLGYLYLKPTSRDTTSTPSIQATPSETQQSPAASEVTQTHTITTTKPTVTETTSTSSQSLTYSGKTDTGVSFTISYPNTWTYYKFSCNADGVAFWPKTVAPDFSNGEACGMNSALNNAPIIAYTMSHVQFSLNNPAYQTVYNQMSSSFHEQASTAPCGLQVTSPAANSYATFPLTISGVIDNTNPGCNWTMFEGYAGSAELSYFTPSQGWRTIANSGASVKPADWTAKKTTFSVTLTFNNLNVGLTSGTHMKATFTPDNPSGKPNTTSVDFPFVLK